MAAPREIFVIGTMDTKSEELLFLVSQLKRSLTSLTPAEPQHLHPHVLSSVPHGPPTLATAFTACHDLIATHPCLPVPATSPHIAVVAAMAPHLPCREGAASRLTLTDHTLCVASLAPSSEDAARVSALRVRGVELDALLADIRAAPRPALSISHPSLLRVPRISPASPPSATVLAAPTAALAPVATFPATVVIAPVGGASSTLNAPAAAPAAGAAGPRRPFKPSLQIAGDAVGGMGGGAPESPEDGAPMTPFVISGSMRRQQGGGFRDEQGRLRHPARKPGVASIAEGVEGPGDKGGGEGGRQSSEVERDEGVVGDGISEGDAGEKAGSEAEETGSAEGKVICWAGGKQVDVHRTDVASVVWMRVPREYQLCVRLKVGARLKAGGKVKLNGFTKADVDALSPFFASTLGF
ncbi:unnamed protein product [Closterium sp. NIES-65]|nr:unnamed protein product [Closterium sp. NIES-65]